MSEESTDGTGIGHPWLDARSLDMARIVVARIDEDPILVHVAHDNLARWRRRHGGLSRAHREWMEILSRPWAEIREILLDDSDEGQRLRSSSPFTGIVTEDERWEIIARHPPPPPLRAISRDDLDEKVMKRILEKGRPRDGRRAATTSARPCEMRERPQKATDGESQPRPTGRANTP